MGPERRLFDPTVAIDRLIRNPGDVFRRTLKYSPTSVKHALIGAVAGVVIVGFTFLAERSNQALPDTNRQYSREAISAGNEAAINNPLLVIAGGAILAVIFGRAAPWLDRKLLKIKAPE